MLTVLGNTSYGSCMHSLNDANKKIKLKKSEQFYAYIYHNLCTYDVQSSM